ncbi:MAG TPA: transcription antitermination factor NusB [Thermoanaerobaculia bacterium]|nr:transcription antitermination factor NusB [Thermoanaerobaculia bacterium]
MADPRPVRELALGVLVRVAREGAHAAPLVDARGRDLAPRDRDFLRALVKKTLRGALRLDHVLARHLRQAPETLDPPVLAALRLGAAQLLLMDRVPPHAAVGETVAAARSVAPKAAGLVNAVLRRVAEKEPRPGIVELPPEADPVRRLALETSHPQWLVARWVAAFGPDAAGAALAADEEDAPMDLLADPRAGTLEEVVGLLAADGIAAVRSPWAPLALTVTHGNAAAHPLVTSGALAVVDAAAQAMVELVVAADVVADLAAAPGGKTRALLATGRARRVVALERTASRARRLAANLAAAGRRGEALVVRADAGQPPLPRGRFASVLLDAPCSGTGTLRKNPEIRLRLRPEDLAGFAETQRRLLRAAFDLVAPGGTLVYVTCSLEPEENEGVVDALLGERPDFALVVPAAGLPVPLAAAVAPRGLVRVLPGATHDGFSAAVLRRESPLTSPEAEPTFPAFPVNSIA